MSVDDQRAARTAATVNRQSEAPTVRPYYQINPQDDRYDFNTGDKIKAILAARNQQ